MLHGTPYIFYQLEFSIPVSDCFHMSFQLGAVFCSSQEIRGFPCQDTELDARVRVQSIPQHIAKETQESDQGENEDNDTEREDKGIHSFHFLALWWWLYSGNLRDWVILYLVIRGWVLLRFLSGSQVSSVAEYPFHWIRKVQ